MEWNNVPDFVEWVMLRDELGNNFFDVYKFIKDTTDGFEIYNMVKFRSVFCGLAEDFKDHVERFFYQDGINADYYPSDLCYGGYNEVLELIDSKLKGTKESEDMQPQTEETAHEPQPEQMTAKLTRGRGRPKETLRDKMIDDADGRKLQRLHEIWGNRKGKEAALLILSCILMGWMSKPTYTQVKEEFGDIGNKAGYNKYLDRNNYTDEEIEGAKSSLIN